MSESSESDDGPANWTRQRRGTGKNSRKIVMRIEFDDSDESSSGSETASDEEPIIRPSGSGRRRQGGGGKRLISSDDDDSSSGSEITRTVVVRGRNKRKAVIVDEDPPAVDEPGTSGATASSSEAPPLQPSSSSIARAEDGFASDSSNDDMEKCPICLLSLRNQEIGKPSVCDHLFCAICIEEWSRNVRTCPIDRRDFDSIVVHESINNRKFVREIKVQGAEKADFETEVGDVVDEEEAQLDLEHCQICHHPDREDVMLLCDGCNRGFHMDCLTPALTEIPASFWYCDDCFMSEEEDLQEEMHVLMEDLREMGVPEQRLRVREVHQPRIPRTRQSERIRASIVARTRRTSTRITSDMDFSQPSSSRQQATAATAASASSSSTRKRPAKRRGTRRRRAGRKRRTYVVEYDVDNYDQKFELETTKKVVRKRKSSKRTSRRKSRKTTARTSGTHKRKAQINDFLAQRTARENTSFLPQPRFSLFGSSADLEYFSDASDGDEIVLGGGDSEVGSGGTAIQTSIRIHSFSSSGRSLARRKGIIRELDQPRQPDILSSILDMQDRFHSATQHNRISAVTIAPDGTLKLPEKKEPSSEKKPDSNQNVAPSDVNQAPMYPRGGGGNNYNNNSGGGGGGYNNRFNNQSNYRNSTGGGGGGGTGGQFRSGNFSGGNNSGGNSGGGFLFNAFRRDSNNFQSDNGFPPNRPNNPDNNAPNRGRFRQNPNQQQRRNPNNQNRYSGPPSLGIDNNINCNPVDTSPSPFNIANLTSRPPPLFGIGSGSMFATPTKLPDSAPPVQTTPLNMSNNSRNVNNFSIPLLQRPPPPILPVYGPMNITGPDPPPPSTPEDLSRTAGPVAPIGPVAPLAPPPWNQNLFRLTSDYADSNDEDDDDSNCPNFSVYSAESFQVARSGENIAAAKATSSAEGGNADSDSVRQEDEYEENEEDLVQLGDDDDIPDALEKGKLNNSNESQSEAANTVPESEIYEPEFPTVEAPDDDEESPDASKEDDEEDRSQKAEDDEKDEDDSETENKVEDDDDGNVHDDESPEGESHDAECSDEDEEDKEVATAEKDSRKKKAGELGLYDDSDYEDIVDQPEFIPMPQDEPSIVASTKTDSGENEENYTPEIDRGDDLEKEGKCSPVEEEGTPSEAHEISRRTPDEEGHTPDEEGHTPDGEGHTPDDEGHTPDEEGHTPDEEGRTPELDDAKLQELAKKKQTDSLSEEEEEPERSYTPCLDEKEHEEANGESREQNTSRSDDRADDSLNVSTNVIDGMEMELISEEDEEMLNDDPNKASRGNDRGNRRDDGGGKRSRKEQFKKISKNTKERNYRDKENRTRPRRRGSKSRSRSRSHSKGKENRHRQRPPPRRTRRKEIERYNVRNVINQPRSFKDRYGRDTSRPARSRSRSRSRSIRRLRSKSRSRSFSPNKDRRSFSMSPTPISAGRPSPRRMSPRRFSPARRMSPRRRFSPRRSRSRSRSRRRSRSLRRTSLPRRRSRTPVRQRSRSMSPGRPNNRRNPRVRRQPSPRPVSRSFSHSVSKFGSRSRSPPPKSPRRSRSGSPFRFKNKRKRSKDRKRKRGKKRTMSMSRSPPPKRATHSVDAPVRKKKKRVRSKSPLLENERWSQSPEHLPEAGMLSSQPNDSSWTPPLVGANSDNLTVILKNKNAANGAGKKKRDKKKKIEKRRDVAGRKERRRQRSEMRESPAAPSKEVFASGNNILVSVSFNKDNPVPQQQTTVVTLPPTREEIMSKRRSAERQPRRTKKSKDKIQRRRKKVDAKPVAIIDLDRSPFQIIQSPRDIIVLTDESDREGDGEGGNKRKNSNTGLEMNVNDRVHDEMQMNSIDKTVDMQRPNQMEEDEQFELQQLGPKTPPDPPTIKFSLAKTKQIKARNPLHDEQEELLQEQAEPEHPDDQMSLHAANKIGPNTPPESGPCSPDAYDPFDPTKSPSMSPSHSPPPPPDSAAEGSPEKIAHSQESNAVEQRPATMPQDKNMNPVDLVMALINTKSSMSQQEMLNKNSDAAGYQMKPDGTDSLNMAGEENLPSKNITVLSNVLISSGKSQNRNNPMLNTSPPIAKLPVAKQSTSRQNGGAGVSNDDIGGGASNEQESPYSPGSADYDDLFEPPPASAENTISLAQLAHNRKNKQDMFDNLFGSTSPGARVKNLRRKAARNIKKAIKVAKTKLEDDQVKIFDELPSSAVELQVKDKFLRKLNRQERVVEEVKLVLKPHYNRKRITKDDYKEILRRAVPKICHSRSGEINPAKIKTLIEAYVKKFRQRNKLNLITGQVSSAVKCAAYLKKL